ncbi:F-box protein-like protein [Tanacetum coccineum]
MSISGRQMKGSKPEKTFLLINRNPVINCVALRVLELSGVSISEEVFEKLLSTCILLEKIDLLDCKGLKNIKIRNLRYLCELIFDSDTPDHILDIYNVPNIRSLNYRSRFQRNPLTLNIDSLRCVTKLSLDGLVMDDSFLDMLKSKFHSLKSLTLAMKSRNSECLDITCPPLKRLYIRRSPFTKIKVYAPKLHVFLYDGSAMPSLLSSEFDIKIMTERSDLEEPLEIDMDDLRTRKSTRNGFWPEYLKEVEIKINDRNGRKWETLTDAWKNCLDGSSLFSYRAEFKLNWF